MLSKINKTQDDNNLTLRLNEGIQISMKSQEHKKEEKEKAKAARQKLNNHNKA